jgi:hypothetical protein
MIEGPIGQERQALGRNWGGLADRRLQDDAIAPVSTSRHSIR